MGMKRDEKGERLRSSFKAVGEGGIRLEFDSHGLEWRKGRDAGAAGGTVYDSRRQRGTLSQIISLSLGWINQVLQGLTAL